MNLRGLNIIFFISGLLSAFACPCATASAAYDTTDVYAMSAKKFYAKTMNLNVSEENLEKEYVICGQTVCFADETRCCVQTSERDTFGTSLAKSATKAGVATAAVGATASATGIGAIAGAPVAIVGGATALVGSVIRAAFGDGRVVEYYYQCVKNSDPIPEGYTEAPEGGYVTRVKTNTGGWFTSASIKEQSCYAGGDQKQYCFLSKEKDGKPTKATVVYNNEGTAFKKCEVLPVKLFENRRCFFCGLFTITYAASNKITSISFDKLAPAFAVLTALGMAIWIAVKLLGQVSSLTKQDAPKFLTELIKQSYKFLIVFLLLQYSHQIFTYGIIPVLSGGMDFGNSLLDKRYSLVEADDGLSDLEKAEQINPGVLKRTDRANGGQANPYYSTTLYFKLDNFVANLQRQLAFMQSVGSSLICIGGNGMLFKSEVITFGTGFVMMIQGIILAAFAFMLSLSFAFYLVDAIVQLGITGAMMPFLIASWPFKLTSKYAATGWNLILNSAFLFVFSCMVLTVNMSLVNTALQYTAQTETQKTDIMNEDHSKVSTADDGISSGSLYGIAQAINSQNEQKLKQQTDISGTGFLILLFCCLFGFKFMNRTNELADKFASGAIKGIAPSIATMAASAALGTAKKFTQPIREAVGGRVSNGVHRLVSAVAHPVRSARGIKNLIANRFSKKHGGNSAATAAAAASTANAAAAAARKNDTPKLGQSAQNQSGVKPKTATFNEADGVSKNAKDPAKENNETEAASSKASSRKEQTRNTKQKRSSGGKPKGGSNKRHKPRNKR